MKQLVIKVGGDPMRDVREAWHNPKLLRPGTHTIYVKTPEEAMDLLSPNRIDLLSQCLKFSSNACVSDLVEKTGRKQEAISRDLSILEKHGAIEKQKKGTKVYIKPKIDEISIKFK